MAYSTDQEMYRREFLKKAGSWILFGLVGASGCVAPSLKFKSRIDISDERVAYHCSQEEAERRLTELAATSDREDAWMYRVRNGKGILIDIGREASAIGKADSNGRISIEDVKIECSICDGDLEPGDEATFYHIHSSFHQPSEFDLPEEYSQLKYFFHTQLPSPQDYIVHLILKKRLGEKVLVKPSIVVGEYTDCIYDVEERDVGLKGDVENAYNRFLHLPGALSEGIGELRKELRERGIILEVREKYDIDKLQRMHDILVDTTNKREYLARK